MLGIPLGALGEIFAEASQATAGKAGDAAVLLSVEIRRLRGEAGLSQPELAVLVGYTRQYISMAERPQKNLPSLDLVRALDAALGAGGTLVALREGAKNEQRARRETLIRRAVSPISTLADASPAMPTPAAVLELRDALTEYRFDVPGRGPAGTRGAYAELRDLKRDLKAAFDAYQQSRFTIAASRVSTLLADVRLVSEECSESDQDEVFGVLALSYQAAASVLVKVGEADLAWVAAERGLTVAMRSGHLAVQGSLVRSVAFSLLSTGRLEPAMRLIDSGARLLEPEIGKGSTTLSVYGMLFLAGAMAAARFGDSARTVDYLHEASSAADRLGRDANDLWTAFGPTNVAIHRVNTAAELGDIKTVLDSTLQLDSPVIPMERRVRYFLDIARAHSLVGHHEEALGTVIKAERMAPDHVRQHHLARKVVATLIQSSPRKSGVELEKLAQRVGIAMAV
ncbi:hypothetical protein BN6_66710 [Saccharothrix espanaensis DSM 44229]|uniref:HTH cro/C1-type domain-containing protein n=2 Tax=Saccharothrix espanaensis TaxID=103731 RepID=K0KB94_SACES|nr:hypothetical protein BN6_66710 [Saccharothrix espanaensis DSM 44229]